LTFKVATQMCATRDCNMVIISETYFQNPTPNNNFGPDTILLQGHAVTLTFQVVT